MKPRMTKRQFEVYELLEQGRGVRDVAEQLGMSLGTAKSHRDRISLKQGAEFLTAREREVADLVRSGLRDVDIGLALGISKRTVELHRQKLFHKMGARNPAHLSAILNEELVKTLRRRVADLEGIIVSLQQELDTLKGGG